MNSISHQVLFLIILIIFQSTCGTIIDAILGVPADKHVESSAEKILSESKTSMPVLSDPTNNLTAANNELIKPDENLTTTFRDPIIEPNSNPGETSPEKPHEADTIEPDPGTKLIPKAPELEIIDEPDAVVEIQTFVILPSNTSNETEAQVLLENFLSLPPEEIVVTKLENSTISEAQNASLDPVPVVNSSEELDLSLAQALAEHDVVVFGPIVLEPNFPPKKSVWSQIANRPCPGCSRHAFDEFARTGLKPKIYSQNSMSPESMQRSNMNDGDNAVQEFVPDDVPLYRRNLMSRRLNSMRTRKLVPELRYRSANLEWVNTFPVNTKPSQAPVSDDRSRGLWWFSPEKWWWPFGSAATTDSPPTTTAATQVDHHDVIILTPKPTPNPLLPTTSPTTTEAAPVEKSRKLNPRKIVFPRYFPPGRDSRSNNGQQKSSNTSPRKNREQNASPPVKSKAVDCTNFAPGSPECPYTYEIPRPIAGKSLLPPALQQAAPQPGSLKCPYLNQFRR